jgi:cytochrome c-type biogenesis protein CcmH
MRPAIRNIFALVLLPLGLVLCLSMPARAVLPSEKLPDPAREARAAELSKRLRCVVCQNQTIDDSAAPLAADMRVLLRERIAAGATDDQAVDFLVERYGNYVLLKPPFQPDTWFLWLAPFGILAIATAAFLMQIRNRRNAGAYLPLNDEERDRLAELY